MATMAWIAATIRALEIIAGTMPPNTNSIAVIAAIRHMPMLMASFMWRTRGRYRAMLTILVNHMVFVMDLETASAVHRSLDSIALCVIVQTIVRSMVGVMCNILFQDVCATLAGKA
eukprot:Plantae.Rhodophyta-Rhodochaete_pulchella.ctg18898.p2 GENE.Plantae.Rhodophyta-Rhodochaete_pulchella.ctg18898~~Plantae.Rhodophyta-Rhodochaete_pulchella.ctg18898.p2  ORF type:complete len:116 (+),score=13.10 Plantae.Rhodophyta-Rhodochaete_pulchella.ctg18898:123-470(+)